MRYSWLPSTNSESRWSWSGHWTLMLCRHGASRRRGRSGSQFSTKRSSPLRTTRVRKRYHSTRSSSLGNSPQLSIARPAARSWSQNSSQARPESRRCFAASDTAGPPEGSGALAQELRRARLHHAPEALLPAHLRRTHELDQPRRVHLDAVERLRAPLAAPPRGGVAPPAPDP